MSSNQAHLRDPLGDAQLPDFLGKRRYLIVLSLGSHRLRLGGRGGGVQLRQRPLLGLQPLEHRAGLLLHLLHLLQHGRELLLALPQRRAERLVLLGHVRHIALDLGQIWCQKAARDENRCPPGPS